MTAIVDLPTPPFLFDTARNCAIPPPLFQHALRQGVCDSRNWAQPRATRRANDRTDWCLALRPIGGVMWLVKRQLGAPAGLSVSDGPVERILERTDVQLDAKEIAMASEQIREGFEVFVSEQDKPFGA